MKSPAPKRAIGRTTGLNLLITAGALTLTLSGWAMLTVTESKATSEAIIEPTAITLPLDVPPLATLVPTPDWTQLTVATPNAIVQPTPQPTPRSVQVPQPVQRPRPLAVTRSSR